MAKKKVIKKAIKKVVKKVTKKKVVTPKVGKVETKKLGDLYPINVVHYMVREFQFDGNTEAKRAIKEGRVTLNGEVLSDRNLELQPQQEVNIEVDRTSTGSML